MKNKWSAGESLQGSVLEAESGVKHPNSKSESCSWIGVLGKENVSPEVLFCRRFSMDGFFREREEVDVFAWGRLYIYKKV